MSRMSPSDDSNNRGGEEAVKRRPTRRSGVELEINMWGLKDLPKTSTVKKAPVGKGYTIKVDRKARNKDIRGLRRATKENDLAVSSLPVYMVTGAPRAPLEQAARDLPTRGEKREDATAASVGCGSSVRSTIQFGSMPVVNIYPCHLTEAEADHYLTNLRRDKWCSACPERLSHAQCTGDRSAPATPAIARTREVAAVAAAAVVVGAARRLPPISGGKAAVPRTLLDAGNSGSGGGDGGGGGRTDGREALPVPVDTGKRAMAMSTTAAGGREAFRGDGKGDGNIFGGGVNSIGRWYAEPYHRVSHEGSASSPKRPRDTDGGDSDLGGIVPAAGRRGGIVLHGQGGGGRGMEADDKYSAEGRVGGNRRIKRVKVDFGVGGAQGSGGSSGSSGSSSSCCIASRSNDSGNGGVIPIASSRSSRSSRSSPSISGGGGDACAKPSSRDASPGRKRTRRSNDDGDGVNRGGCGMDVNTALGYDDDHKHRVISVRAAGGKDEVFRRTRGSSGQNKRSRSMKVS